MSKRRIREPSEVVDVRRDGRWWRFVVSCDKGDRLYGIRMVGDELGKWIQRIDHVGPGDVRTPRKRKTTGKVRGRGGKGGWVYPGGRS